MKTWNNIPRHVCWLAAVAAAAHLALAAKVDLSRRRPSRRPNRCRSSISSGRRSLGEPKLNLAGTHIAAILNTAEDHSELIVYDLKTQTLERIGAQGNDDIATVDWLDSKRLIYGIGMKKLGTTGQIAAEVGELQNAYPLIQFVGSYLIAVPPEDRVHPVVHLVAHTQNTGQYGEVVVLGTDVRTGEILQVSGPTLSTLAVDVMTENNTKHIVRRYPILKTDAGGDFRYLADREGRLAFGFKAQDGRSLPAPSGW